MLASPGQRRSSAIAVVLLILCLSDLALDDEAHQTKVRVALIDGGVADVGALACFDIEQVSGVAPSDHGTAMASVILGAVNSSCVDEGGVILGSFPVLDADGTGATADEIAKAVSAAVAWNADFVNISIDARNGSKLLDASVRQAAADGVIVVAAAGNRMGLRAGYPAQYESVVSVGAADTDGSVLPTSAIDGVDVYEVGVAVAAVDACGELLEGEGTSFASAAYTRRLSHALR